MDKEQQFELLKGRIDGMSPNIKDDFVKALLYCQTKVERLSTGNELETFRLAVTIDAEQDYFTRITELLQ